MKKIIALSATFLFLISSFLSTFTVLAQEATTAPEPTTTPTAAILETSSATPTTTADLATLTSSPTPTLTITPAPSPTSTTTSEDLVDPVSATINTDKPDYSAFETVLITGSGFAVNKTYVIYISSSDYPAISVSDNVTSDSQGYISYSYQLDGNYRPNYQVEIKDGGIVVAFTTFTDANESADLDQYGNDAPAGWQNGNLNDQQATYFEGDSVPYRMKFGALNLSSHTVIIEWDTTKSGKHAIDYLTSFDRTVGSANPCDGVSGCSSFSSFAIPNDPQVTGAGVAPVAGSFKLYGGTITNVSSYTYPDGSGFSGDKSARIAITFTASVANPVLAWGGHISTRADWGLDNAAVNITGSPYHMRLIDLDGKGGNQDRSLSADAVIFPGSITVVKQATPEGQTSFGFTATPAPLTNFSLTDDGTSLNTKIFSNITNFQNYSINESSIPAGWGFDSVGCSVTSQNGGSVNYNTTTSLINMKEGENWTCTYNNSIRNGTLTVIKHVVNDDGGSALASSFTLYVKLGSSNVSGSPAQGSEQGTNYSLPGGTYTISEDLVGGYQMTGFSGDCDSNGNVTLAVGENKTCTITNDDIQPKLTLVKTVVNNYGGTLTANDFPLFVNSTSVLTGQKNGFDAGSYTASETQKPGYLASSWGGDCAADGSITLALGDDKTCTITNSDIQPKLTLIKTVINNNGGIKQVVDFPLFVSGTQVTSSVANGFNAGSYTASETSLSGYSASSWGGDCAADGSVSLSLGDDKTCTITNDDIAPTLTVNKILAPSSDAGKFNLQIDGTTYAANVGDGGTTGSITLSSGLHTVGETQGTATLLSDYQKEISGDCASDGTITLNLGENKTCTITNTRLGSIQIIKDAVPNDLKDFEFTGGLGTFYLDDDQGVAGIGENGDVNRSNEHLSTGLLPQVYIITETNPNDFWSLGGITCSDVNSQTPYTGITVNGNSLDINLIAGKNVSCTFVNNKLTPTRTQGFWQTHTDFTSQVFGDHFAGGMQIGFGIHKGVITNIQLPGSSQLFGGYYSSISMKSSGKGKTAKRTPLEQARMTLLQQLITAKLNCAEFGCPSAVQTLISQADTAYGIDLITPILNYAGLLDDFNNSGDTLLAGYAGKATPKTSQSYANIPFWDIP